MVLKQLSLEFLQTIFRNKVYKMHLKLKRKKELRVKYNMNKWSLCNVYTSDSWNFSMCAFKIFRHNNKIEIRANDFGL